MPPFLVSAIQKALGNCLFNLYGTSEAGVLIMAVPSDLLYSVNTIGRPLPGVKIQIIDDEDITVNQGCIGQLSVKCKWSVKPKEWIKTGDLVYIDKSGYYYHMGRVDDMIVSGCENVYPSELEDIIKNHSLVDDVVVKGIYNSDYGQCLKAFVVLKSKKDISENDLLDWIRQQVYRYQVPKELKIVDSLPTNTILKIDKKKLI